jgi:hypothetical protein
MQKFMKILEQQVQWIALGLGVLWMLWTGYSYWVTPPDMGQVNKQSVAPGDIDEEVLKSGPVQSLESAHQNELPIPEGLLAKLAGTDRPQYVDNFKQLLAGSPAVAVGPSPFPASPFDPIKGPQQGPGQAQLSDLPDPQGALTLESAKGGGPAAQTGMSVVSRPNTDVPVLPQGAPGAGPQKTITNPLNPNAQPIAFADQEVTWITVSGMIDMKKLAASFQKANIPELQAFTALLRTELVRQEMQPNGNWVNDKVVPNLTNAFLPPWPPAGGQAEVDYLTWATANTPLIVEPPFYEVLRGQLWKTVVMQDPNEVSAQPQVVQFDPSKVLPGQVLSLPPDQLAIWRKWHQEQEAQQAQQHKSQAPAHSSPSGGGGAASGGARGDAGPSSRFGARIILVGDHGDMGGSRPRNGAADGPGPARTFVQPQGVPFDTSHQQMAIPNGQFLPSQQVQDLEVWAHDETTVPDVIYRYKLRVYLKNPLFGTVNVAKNPADAKVFWIPMETADWSKPIVSPKKHEFFVINGGTTFNGVQKVGIDYLDWQDGTWKLTSMTLQPGDRVGQTPWTIVDLRPAGGNEGDSRVLLINDDGQLITRFYKTDRIDAEYLNLKKLVPPPAVPTGTGGTPSASGV